VRGLGSLIILTIKIITTMTKKELIEIIDFLTEECVNKIVYDLNDIAFTPYMAKYEDWEGTLNPASVEVYNYYERIRSYFINQLLAKDKKELTEEEYQRVIDEYELKFVDKFGEALTDKFLDGDSEDSEEELNEQIDNTTEKSYEEMTDEDFALSNKDTFEELVIEYEDIIDELEGLSNSLGYEIDCELEVPYEEEQMDRLEKMYERVNMAHGALESLYYEIKE
jgi:hypothetical protein